MVLGSRARSTQATFLKVEGCPNSSFKQNVLDELSRFLELQSRLHESACMFLSLVVLSLAHTCDVRMAVEWLRILGPQ